jgi:hypothetical protein
VPSFSLQRNNRGIRPDFRSGQLQQERSTMDTENPKSSAPPAVKLRVALRWVTGVICFVGFIWFHENAFALSAGIFLFPLVYYLGVRTILQVPILVIIALYVPVAAFWLHNSAFHALDLLLTLVAIYPLRWVHRYADTLGGTWRERKPLITFVGFFIWLDFLATPLESTIGSDYQYLQDVELLQTVDIDENYAVLTIIAGVLFIPAYIWHRFMKAQQRARAASSDGQMTPTRQELLALVVTRAATFAILNFTVESFNLESGWVFAAFFVFCQLCLDVRERRIRLSSSRFDRVLVRVQAVIRSAGRSRAVSASGAYIRAHGRYILSIPALFVILALTWLHFFVSLTSSPLSDGSDLLRPVHAVDAKAAECATTIIDASEFGHTRETDDFKFQMAALRAEERITTSQYDFIIRLNEVTVYRYLKYGETSADVKWAIVYTKRMAGLWCNSRYPR